MRPYNISKRLSAMNTSQGKENVMEVLSFWFDELTFKDWFHANEELDKMIRDRFGKLHDRATACELSEWRSTADGALAEIIILDQFSRHLYREDPRVFAYDSLALALAQEAISKGFNEKFGQPKLGFLYMPFMHSESRKIHEQALELFSSHPGLELNLDFEKKHKEIIDRFGRYPHRNKILGRVSTDEELEFLKQPGHWF